MHEVNCYICNSKHSENLFKQGEEDTYLMQIYDVFPDNLYWKICLQCGLVYRSPVLDNDEIKELYNKYDQNIVNDEDKYFDKIIKIPREDSENWIKTDWLFQSLESVTGIKNLNVLDVGCGGGTLLYTLKSLMPNINLYGVELNKKYYEIAKKNLEINIKNEEYKSNLFGCKFDILINTKVLEHISDPLIFLENLNKDLKDDGHLFIEVPDVSDMYSFPANDERFFIPHIFFYSEITLSILLERSGFEVLKKRVSKSNRGRSYLQIIAKKQMNEISKITEFTSTKDIQAMIKKIKQNMTK
tara:strand:- start:555 stop:1454 length:900 start_codon:yes stop_codon:yes gene_type:complete